MGADTAKSWPFEQARALLKTRGSKQGEVIFQTGYGPSGAPHVGTFGEVVRTNMVRNAFEELTGNTIPTRLIAFSDDYDGFRKVPEGMPESMHEDLGKPLTAVRDPFGEYPSFAARNNQALRDFLDRMEVGYDFVSATECYKSGAFNAMLRRVVIHYETVRNIMLPTLGETRRATYSPFMPISPVTGNVLAEGVLGVDEMKNTIFFVAEDGKEYEVSVFDGNTKLQWKADWGMRWAAFGVDYEMHGKDLLESAVLSTRICKAINATPPLTYFYELFLDDEGRKQSKSLGNGMTMAEWERYSSTGPLAHFMFQSPRSAKAFTPTVIPRVTDEYLKALTAFPKLEGDARLDSPVWHVHEGSPPPYEADVSYALLLNLASVSAAKDSATLMNYLQQYKALTTADRAFVGSLLPGVIAFIQEQTPPKTRRAPKDVDKAAFAELATILETMEDGLDAEAYQFQVYEVGKRHYEPLRDWFKAIYEVLFGDEQGPRFGTFIAAYGRARTIELLRSVL
jgi:lysyl-tRNA synthetase class 1